MLITIQFGADFAHIFDVKAGAGRPPAPMFVEDDGIRLADPDGLAATRMWWDHAPLAVDETQGVVTWELGAGRHERARISLSADPVVNGAPTGRATLRGSSPARPVALRDLTGWRDASPHVTSPDPRLALAVDQALADLAALQIHDVAHPDRIVVAAGAPWFMTLFGRDSLLTTWMSLPFDELPRRASSSRWRSCRALVSTPSPRRSPARSSTSSGDGAEAVRSPRASRYFGSIDATPLFVMVVAEAWRWGALDATTLDQLRPAIEDAVGWLTDHGANEGFLTYERRSDRGLSNQGWKDSWDGITFADGSLPSPDRARGGAGLSIRRAPRRRQPRRRRAGRARRRQSPSAGRAVEGSVRRARSGTIAAGSPSAGIARETASTP